MVLLLIAPVALYSQQESPPKKHQSSVDKLNEDDFKPPPPPTPKPVERKPRKEPARPAEPAPSTQPKDQVSVSKSRAPGEIWRQPVTGMKFVWVPGGCSQMGQSEEEKRRLIREAGEELYGKYWSDELPQQEVCVDGYWMGKTEVTVGAFRRFVEATGYRTDAEKEKEGFSWIRIGKNMEKRSGANWRDAGFRQTEDHPVVNVSWNDASAMAEWLSRQGGGRFRLPTEAEWEYGCRAGTKTARYWGDSPAEACRYANVADRAVKRIYPDDRIHECDDGHAHTSPVGSYQENDFGLLDMLGNVWEWCEDIYTKDAYVQRQGRTLW